MKKRTNYKKHLATQLGNIKMAKITTACAVGVALGAFSTPVFASEWVANTPDNIQIEQETNSYTMKYGDTLWAISVKININVNTLASVNNINLSSGEQFTLKVGTVIHFSEAQIKAVNSNGHAINDGVKVNDSNKIVVDKLIGVDVSKEVTDGKASNSDIVGTPDNTAKLPAPNTNGNLEPSNPITPEVPTEPQIPIIPPVVDPETPVEPEKPTEPSTPTNKDVYVAVNIDEKGAVLESTIGYDFVSESTDKKIDTLENGNTVTTYTTTKVWKKKDVTPPSDFYVGQVLYTSKAFATSAEANTHMWEVSAEWFDFGYANNISVKPSAFGGGGKYYVTVTVEALNVN